MAAVQHFPKKQVSAMKKFDRSFWINLIFLILAAGLLVFISIKYGPEFTGLVSNPKKFREFILSYGPLSALVFMLFQVIQVVIAFIPGEFVQIAGGYIYGTLLGTLYSLIGITIGCVIVFSTVRLLGFHLVKHLVSEKNIQKFYDLINKPGSEFVIFLLFFLPGLPKDVLVYISGLTPVKPLQFFIIVITARLPAMVGASFIGANIQRENYYTAIIITIISCILFVVGFLYKDKIIAVAKQVFAKKEKL
jgi:uncharacterized membrane protein YdjX (TVP38/TMEM64 family)